MGQHWSTQFVFMDKRATRRAMGLRWWDNYGELVSGLCGFKVRPVSGCKWIFLGTEKWADWWIFCFVGHKLTIMMTDFFKWIRTYYKPLIISQRSSIYVLIKLHFFLGDGGKGLGDGWLVTGVYGDWVCAKWIWWSFSVDPSSNATFTLR